MAAARKFEWTRGNVEQEPTAMHLRSSAVNDCCLSPFPTGSQLALPDGFNAGASEWIATNGQGIIGGVLARSSVAKRIQEADRPLMLARSQPKSCYSRILIPVDFSRASVSAAKAVLRAGSGTQLVFLASFSMFGDAAMHARPRHTMVAPLLSDVCCAARTRLARFVEQLNVQTSLVSVVARHGELDAVTRSYADLMRADLIVIGRRSVPRLEAVLLGSPEWRLSQEVESDILIVPE